MKDTILVVLCGGLLCFGPLCFAQRRTVQQVLQQHAPDTIAKFGDGNIDCPAIPIPVSDVIVQVDKCLEPLGRDIRDREVKAITGELEDCAQAGLLIFMMTACQDAVYLDKTVDCVFARQDVIINKLQLTEFEANYAKKLFLCARKIHENVKSKRKS